jgi:2-polyprenyl-3-methyl-5-hydroxy-6-metoxy-1,4-benzoquinol methylase
VTGAADLTVVIPTRDRWPTLRRTLEALRRQTVQGFAIVVSVDGDDQDVPDLGAGVEVVQRRLGGSASARNAGAARVRTEVMLLLDDDMVPVPDLVARHLAVHDAHPEVEAGALGCAQWHPELRPTAVSRWLDWSNMMFDFEKLRGCEGTDVGWGRFFSCNVSIKTALFERVGGFDETFIHYYEDTDLAKRLGESGLRLYYEPRALSQHLQEFDWPAVQRRFDRVALGERLMVRKHADFRPWFKPMMEGALHAAPVRSAWVTIADRLGLVPGVPEVVRRPARERAHRHRLQQLAPSYLAAYRRAEALCELMDYLGDRYDPKRLIHNDAELDRESEAYEDEEDFYRSSEMYLYNLTIFEMSGTKEPYRAELVRHLRPGARVLDYGCGIGADGLALGDEGFDVSFADFANPSTELLRWRLARRGRDAPVYDLDRDEVPSGFDAVFCFDVIEHIDDPFAFLERLESLADLVMVNFLEPDPDETHLHKPLPVDELLARCRARGLVSYELHHGRSHLVAYAGLAAGSG